MQLRMATPGCHYLWDWRRSDDDQWLWEEESGDEDGKNDKCYGYFNKVVGQVESFDLFF